MLEIALLKIWGPPKSGVEQVVSDKMPNVCLRQGSMLQDHQNVKREKTCTQTDSTKFRIRLFIQSCSLLFNPIFSLWKIAGSAALRLVIPHGFQQYQIVLLVPHQDGTKAGWRYNHATNAKLKIKIAIHRSLYASRLVVLYSCEATQH